MTDLRADLTRMDLISNATTENQSPAHKCTRLVGAAFNIYFSIEKKNCLKNIFFFVAPTIQNKLLRFH